MADTSHRKNQKSTSSHADVFLGKGVLKICNKSTGEHLCRSVISVKLQSNFTEITIQHGCFSCKFAAHFQNIFSFFRTPLDGCFWKSIKAFQKVSYETTSKICYSHEQIFSINNFRFFIFVIRIILTKRINFCDNWFQLGSSSWISCEFIKAN